MNPKSDHIVDDSFYFLQIVYISYMKKFFGCTVWILLLFTFSCRTQTFITNGAKLKGKRIAVSEIVLANYIQKDAGKTDTLCHCIATSAMEAFYPYLQQMGMNVIQLPVTGRVLQSNIQHLSDSLQLDYILVGKGIVQFAGKSTFMRSLSLQIVDVKTLEVRASGIFEGTRTAAGAAIRIGKKMVRKMK